MEKGIIYKVTNKETEDVYVGITTKSIQERKKDHLKKSKKGKSYAFQNAIGTYGADAFKWEQIDTAVTTDELAKKEKEYILKYNSKEDGYNSDEGGGIKKTVYKYDIISGKLLQKYDDLDSASRTVNSNKKQISKICLSVNQKYRGYFWSYKYEEPFIPNIDSRKKVVQQLTLKGKFIKEFNSVSEAAKQTGCNKTSIAKVCRGERKSSGGFYWEYNN